MIAPIFPENEMLRQKAVEKYQLLDTLPEESYDSITNLMAHVCDTPISLVTLLDKDRNFLKSHHGIPFNESPREISFCGHAINSDERITIIEDARKDHRFHDNPLVEEHNAVFYAGVPLIDPDGFKLGTLCVYDVKPRQLTDVQKSTLLSMARQVISLFEERYKNFELQRLQEKLEQRNENLERFAGVVSHDLKSPLAQITSLTELLEQDIGENLNDENLLYLEYIKSSSDALRGYIDGILKFYKADNLSKRGKETTVVISYINEIKNMFGGHRDTEIKLETAITQININKAALTQILVNLISNGIKYNDKEKAMVTIALSEKEDRYYFSVSDNGPGIATDFLDKIFELFTVGEHKDKNGNKGTGIGLATVKKMVSNLEGEIQVESIVGNGSIFHFNIKK